MDEAMDDLITKLQISEEARERRQAINKSFAQIENWPLSKVEDAFDSLKDIFDKDAQIQDRALGFHFLCNVLKKDDIGPEIRSKYLRAVLHEIDSEGFDHQIEAIASILQTRNSLDPEATAVIDYLQMRVLTQFQAKRAARERLRSETKSAGKDVSLEDKGFNHLLDILTVIIHDFKRNFTKESVINLYNDALWVAEKASETSTVERICLLIEALLRSFDIPSSVLSRCVEDLCAIYSTTQRLQDLTRECFMLLLQNDAARGTEVQNAILKSICSPPHERASYTACGAIKISRFITLHQDDQSLPRLGLNQLVNAISTADLKSKSICKECLRTISVILSTESLVEQAISIEDWEPMLDVIQKASTVIRKSNQNWYSTGTHTNTLRSSGYEEAIFELIGLVTHDLAEIWPRCQLAHKQQIARFYENFKDVLPPGYVIQFILGLYQRQYFSDCHTGWKKNQNQLVDLFYESENSTQETRCTVIKILKSGVTNLSSDEDRKHLHGLVIRLLISFQSRKDLQVGNALAELILMESRPQSAPLDFLQSSIHLIWPLLSVPDDSLHSGEIESDLHLEYGNSNTVTESLIELFLRCYSESRDKSIAIFDLLVAIAQAHHLSSSVRLPAIRLLVRIRCEINDRVIIVAEPDLQDLPAALFHTEFDSARKLAGGRTPISSEKLEARSNRISGLSNKSHSASWSNPKSLSRTGKHLKTKLPVWFHPGSPALPTYPPGNPSDVLQIYGRGENKSSTIHIGEWLVTAISILQHPTSADWEIYSYVVTHLPAQLSNRLLFARSMPHIGMLRRILVDQLLEGSFYEPPPNSGARKGDVAICLFHALTMLIGYSDTIERKEQERIVHAFYHGIGEWERTAKFCIQALAICCHVLPSAVVPRLSAILQKMSQVVTQSYLTIDILEFLSGLARLRPLYVNFREEEYRTVFAICVRYLEHSRSQRARLLTKNDIASPSILSNAGQSNNNDVEPKPDPYEDLPQYVFALAYQVITIWFLSVKISNRNDHVGWITRNLSWTDEAGNEIMEEQSQVTLDMMLRTSYLNLGETEPGDPFTEVDGPILNKTWILGLSIVTVETGAFTGVSRVTKRQASGTTYAVYRPQTSELPPHHEPTTEFRHGSDLGIGVFPNHILLQLISSIAPTPTPMEAICLPDDDAIRRAISVFDRNDTVDGYKVGVIYVSDGQGEESNILANNLGSPAFEAFLSKLGTKIRLKGAKFNTQGLDRNEDLDGTHTYAWRDRTTELVFHVPTMMPTDLDHDPQCVNKKKHIGNDYVNVIWNESGQKYRFDTLRSQFNCVNIVIVPDAFFYPRLSQSKKSYDIAKEDEQCFCTVQMISAPSFPELSPVSTYKLIPLKTLPLLVRQLALQASVFSNVWVNRDTGEHASSWRNRLREIKRIRERFANTGTSTSSKFPGAKSSKLYSQGDTFVGKVTMGGLSEEGEYLAASLDFSRWAGPNAPLSSP